MVLSPLLTRPTVPQTYTEQYPFGAPGTKVYATRSPTGGSSALNSNPSSGALGMTPASQNPITFPQRSTYSQFLPTIQSGLNASVPKVQAIPGLDDSYFQSLFNTQKNRLNNEFFGVGGQDQKLEETLASRGLLGSNLEYGAQGARTALQKNFADALAEVGADISRQQSEQRLAEAMERRKLEQTRGLTLGELGLRSALTEAAEANKFGIGRFEQEVNLEQTRADTEEKRRQQLLDFLLNPDASIGPNQQTAILDRLFPGIPAY